MSLSSSAQLDFETFFQHSYPEMLARAQVLSRSRQDAEDAVQEAYVEALSRWDRIADYDNPGAWVYKIVRQRLWKSTRRWTRQRPLASDEAIAWPSVSGNPERFVEVGLVLSALAELPDRQRMVMVMHCLHDMGQQQIADELGLSRGAVAASIFKARRRLEKALCVDSAGLATLDPGNSIMGSEPASDGGSAIKRRRDPLAAYLDAVLFWLRQSAPAEGSEPLLNRVYRAAHARANEPGDPE